MPRVTLDDFFPYSRQPYVRKLQDAIAAGAIPRVPGDFLVLVRHDPACPLLAGAGYCACEPDLEVVAAPSKDPGR